MLRLNLVHVRSVEIPLNVRVTVMMSVYIGSLPSSFVFLFVHQF